MSDSLDYIDLIPELPSEERSVVIRPSDFIIVEGILPSSGDNAHHIRREEERKGVDQYND
jgi:hypothetical protein